MTAVDGAVHGEVELLGRIETASNATFLARIGDVEVVYKPTAGERPLWDFPDGNLSSREYAAFLVSEALGWRIVPPTWLADGPFGSGMFQRWQDIDPDQEAVDLVPIESIPEHGWLEVLHATDETDRPVALVHEDSPQLRRMAVFDVLVNNADRKGGHVLAMSDGHRFGVDHGLTFHVEHKLRTVLWGWVGDALLADEIAGVERLAAALRGSLGAQLADLLTASEVSRVEQRCARLLDRGSFPAPRGSMPAVPWPLF
ncbi:SCO1664 family protein [Curtobacterium ammoniigenes]|uniref:SCO1664 family protein n=1 Tax=Curtobacterium ammoniigenes TaxID=395387 RepID=UPI00082F759A|nr:SCO1664 family protein [Curtobacterium ammoniigenes]